MDNKNNQKIKTSQESHKTQSFWQIFFPVFLVIAGLSAVAYKIFQSSQSGFSDIRIWADISAILIILPLFLIILLFFLFIILLSVLLSKSSNPLREGFGKLNQVSLKIQKACLSTCKAVQKAFIETETYTSIIKKK